MIIGSFPALVQHYYSNYSFKEVFVCVYRSGVKMISTPMTTWWLITQKTKLLPCERPERCCRLQLVSTPPLDRETQKIHVYILQNIAQNVLFLILSDCTCDIQDDSQIYFSVQTVFKCKSFLCINYKLLSDRLLYMNNVLLAVRLKVEL